MAEIKIYGYATSPFVRKVGCFLYYKELDFEHVPVSPVDPQATLSKFGGSQVPVLEIGDEWRRNSSDIGHWLDERFPDKPLCPSAHRELILEIDRWVNSTFLPSTFRAAIDGGLSLNLRFRFWRLAALVSAHTPLPEKIRHKWPEFVGKAPFIQAMAEGMDLSESMKDMQMRIAGELVGYIGDGPFIGGLEMPTMLDFAVFPQLIFGFLFGLEDKLSAAQHPVLKEWMIKVAEHLPENPTLAADDFQLRTLSEGLS